MGEVKNAFIKSKMNKDLDSRLLPSGEYRHAQNVQVSKSEGADVGAVENILGNAKLADLTQSIPNVSSIGYFADNATNTVYVFLTDNDTKNYVTTGAGSNHFIFKYKIGDTNPVKLVEGAFLNFSKLNPIFGVNLLENLLFWTDNRNQPRKINVDRSFGYYTNEDQISVAKYYPFQSIELFKESDLATTPGIYETTMKDVVSKNLPNGGSATIDTAVVNSAIFDIANISIPTFPNQLQAGFTVGYVGANGDIIDTEQTVMSYTDPTLELSGDVDIPLIDSSTELVFNANPYYEQDYSGDASFLEDKFIRFSYRFKFDDGEYSLIAPFTQTCFIPKQDGYFLNRDQNIVGPDASADGDEKQTLESSIVKFMENKVNKIYLQIPLPETKSNLKSYFHIEEIDIIYKESDGLALQVLETIKVDQDFTGTETILEHEYSAKKPYKTLPSNEVTRVYDKVPLKALSQEVISNRIVYGNYVNKPTPPSSLNYNVSATEKFDFNLNTNRTSSVEYPSSSLKTNRDYQVGFVLADRFGRQSSVILSDNKEAVTVGSYTYSGSTLYSPYINEDIGANIDSWKGNSLKILLNDPIPGDVTGLYNGEPTDPNYNPTGWYSYKIVVKQTQQDYYNVYTAGAVKGDPLDSTKNKDYTYISLQSDNINKVPRDLSEVGPLQKQFRSSVKLYGRVDIDNRLNENDGADNSQFYPGKLFFTANSIQGIYDTFGVDQFDTTTWPDNNISGLFSFRNVKSNPLLARLTTSQKPSEQFGLPTPDDNIVRSSMANLTVLETEPEESRLDIFWETSTSGIIEELNLAAAGDNLVTGFSDAYNLSGFNEAIAVDEYISSGDFALVDSIGANIPDTRINSFAITSVFNTQATPLDVSSYFTLEEISPGFYNIKVTSDFINNVFYSSDQGLRVWNFTFTAVISNEEGDVNVNIINKTVNLNNVTPVMFPSGTLNVDTDGSNSRLSLLTATNGASSLNPNRGKEINWFIHSQSGANSGTINYFRVSFSNTDILSECEVLNNRVGTLPSDVYTVVVRAEDAGGVYDEVTITINASIQVNYVRQYTFTVDQVSYVFTLISADDSTNNNRTGFYGYLDSWANLSINSPIQLDYTNSAKFSNCPVLPNKWMFNGAESTAIDKAKECLLEAYQGPTNFINIDFEGLYTFEIV